jgi:hypothetical protein
VAKITDFGNGSFATRVGLEDVANMLQEFMITDADSSLLGVGGDQWFAVDVRFDKHEMVGL